MRAIRSPLDGFRSPFGKRAAITPPPAATSLRQRNGASILDRFGAEIFLGPQGEGIPANAFRQRDDALIYNRAGNYMELI